MRMVAFVGRTFSIHQSDIFWDIFSIERPVITYFPLISTLTYWSMIWDITYILKLIPIYDT